ncbi:MAG: NAD(P)/FAD-dependent oxidoreductase [Deltaproteobacteria bacterium]|nr:NAD(P)/FAD-dependent oxidoreductase [Deltaproteobacteria bacterium]
MTAPSKESVDSAQQYDVVIVGAGMGGLACALALARKGRRVKVLEQHSVPGGYCTAFERKGFVFDAAVHFVMECGEGGALRGLVEELGLGKEIAFSRIDPSIRIFLPDGEDVALPSSAHDFVTILIRKFPDEEKGIRALFKVMETLYEDSKKFPDVSSSILEYGEMVFQELLDRHLKSKVLKSIVAAPQIYLPPATTTSALYMSGLIMSILDVGLYYPRGGTQGMANRFADNIRTFGGDVEVRSMVDKIIVEGGRAVGVETRDGRRIKANYVVSNADALQTFFGLIGEELLDPETVRNLKGLDIRVSAFLVYLGVDLDLQSLEIANHEMILIESYDREKEYESILRGKVSSLSITIPTLTDPEMAPENKHCVSLFSIAPYHLKGKDWKSEKKRIAEDLIRKAEAVIPDLSKHIVVRESATPLTLERFTLNHQGSMAGWDPSPGTMFNRPMPKTPIENLYLTGHWTLPGVGVSGVISSGCMVADMISSEMEG